MKKRAWSRKRVSPGFLLFTAPIIFLVMLLVSPALAAGDSLCAEVKIQVNQELTLERQAFDAHMRINNGLSHITLEDVDVDVRFFDEEGNVVHASFDPDDEDALFFIRVDSTRSICQPHLEDAA